MEINSKSGIIKSHPTSEPDQERPGSTATTTTSASASASVSLQSPPPPPPPPSSLSSGLFWQRLKSDLHKIPRKKVVIIGDERCGKTCLAMCFPRKKQNNKTFFENYVPTVFENNLATIDLEDNKKIELALWDTAGREKFDSLRPLCYTKCDVLLMCYSVDSTETMQSILRKWEPEASRYCPEALIVLVGLKKDLRDNRKGVVLVDDQTKEINNKRMVSSSSPSSMVSLEQGQLLAEIVEAYGFCECSTKNNEGIDNIIRIVTNAALCVAKNKSARKRRQSINSHTFTNNTSEDAENNTTPSNGCGCCNFFGL